MSELESLGPAEFETRANAIRAAWQQAESTLLEDPRYDLEILGPLFDRLVLEGREASWQTDDPKVATLILGVQAERGEYASAFRAITAILDSSAGCP